MWVHPYTCLPTHELLPKLTCPDEGEVLFMRTAQLAKHEGRVDLAKRRVIATRLNVGLLQRAGQRLDRGS
jgi:hypothetical protein